MKEIEASADQNFLTLFHVDFQNNLTESSLRRMENKVDISVKI